MFPWLPGSPVPCSPGSLASLFGSMVAVVSFGSMASMGSKGSVDFLVLYGSYKFDRFAWFHQLCWFYRLHLLLHMYFQYFSHLKKKECFAFMFGI